MRQAGIYAATSAPSAAKELMLQFRARDLQVQRDIRKDSGQSAYSNALVRRNCDVVLKAPKIGGQANVAARLTDDFVTVGAKQLY